MNTSTEMTEQKLERLARIASERYYDWQSKQVVINDASATLTGEIAKLEKAHQLEIQPYKEIAQAAHENYTEVEIEIRDGVLQVYANQPDKRKKTYAEGAVQVAVSKNGIVHMQDELRAINWCIANGHFDFFETKLKRKEFVAAAKKGTLTVPEEIVSFEDKHTPRIITPALLELELQPED